jgi:hypothetical protein
MNKDYEKAKKLRIILEVESRWGNGIDHHKMSIRLMKFLQEIDYNDNNDLFCWKSGGDGDNGEDLMFEMDAFFEYLDMEKQNETT